jgi:hypothetical protein
LYDPAVFPFQYVVEVSLEEDYRVWMALLEQDDAGTWRGPPVLRWETPNKPKK